MVTTERMLNTPGQRPVRTDRFVDTWIKESGASGSDVTPLQGPWRRGAVIRDQGHPERVSLLADDAGVVVQGRQRLGLGKEDQIVANRRL